jgi:tetratricopeptide (TPR) repeat protein
LKAAAEVRQQQFHEAENDLRDAVSADPENSALHFALGVVYRQEDESDESYDELARATKIMPDLPENHAALSYLFYRLDDGPNAIAEARTALSIDPENAEAYQYLGLGLYSTAQYPAAVHAYEEALVRTPQRGIRRGPYGDRQREREPALRHCAYQQAMVGPSFWEATSEPWRMILRQGSRAGGRELPRARRIAPAEASIRGNLGGYLLRSGAISIPPMRRASCLAATIGWRAGTCLPGQRLHGKKHYDSMEN